MISLTVCVGSSCHMRGSYQVIQIFERLIADHQLQEKIQLKAAFCLGKCMSGISVSIGETALDHVNVENAEQIFLTQIVPIVKEISQ